jgi:hypothetical protein
MNIVKSAEGKFDWFKIVVITLLLVNLYFTFSAGSVADRVFDEASAGKRLCASAVSYASDAADAAGNASDYASDAADYASEAADYASNCLGN